MSQKLSSAAVNNDEMMAYMKFMFAFFSIKYR